jgi:hypothetical protein
VTRRSVAQSERRHTCSHARCLVRLGSSDAEKHGATAQSVRDQVRPTRAGRGSDDGEKQGAQDRSSHISACTQADRFHDIGLNSLQRLWNKGGYCDGGVCIIE